MSKRSSPNGPGKPAGKGRLPLPSQSETQVVALASDIWQSLAFLDAMRPSPNRDGTVIDDDHGSPRGAVPNVNWRRSRRAILGTCKLVFGVLTCNNYLTARCFAVY